MPLSVTEIAPDHPGADNFEFFELTNYSDDVVDLTGWAVSYIYSDSTDADRDVALALDGDNLTIAPGETVVVWLKYSSDSVNSDDYTEADFRENWGDAGSSYRILTATGQPGMANGGERGIRLVLPVRQREQHGHRPIRLRGVGLRAAGGLEPSRDSG
jgi:hypothetical protein